MYPHVPWQQIKHTGRTLTDRLSDEFSGTATSTLALAISLLPLFALFLGLHWWLMRVTMLTETGYTQPTIALSLLQEMGAIQLAGVALTTLMLIWVGTVHPNWSAIDNGLQWRPFIFVIVLILTWTYATYDYNLYFNQSHAVDRLLLIVLALVIWWRPFFLLPFAVLVTAIIWQFSYPIGGFSVTEQFVLVRILILFWAAHVLGALPPSLSALRGTRHAFAFLLLTLVAASYWWPGVGKLRLSWFTHGQIYYLLPASYASGWLGFLPADTIVRLTQFLAGINPLMVVFTLLAECGALFFLWRRRVAIALLFGWAGLHTGIVLVSGIFFWKWILVDLSLALLLLRDRAQRLFPIFSRKHFLLGVVLIGGGHYWYLSANFAWYDIPINYAFRFQGIGESGQRYELPPRFFAPYDYQFSLGAFGYLVPEPRLNIIYGGAWQRSLVDALGQASSAEEVFLLEEVHGRSGYDPERAAAFDTFIRKSIRQLNKRGTRATFLSSLQPPSHLLSFPYVPDFEGQEPLTTVTVYQVTSYYDGGQYSEIRDVAVRTVEVSQ